LLVGTMLKSQENGRVLRYICRHDGRTRLTMLDKVECSGEVAGRFPLQLDRAESCSMQ